MDGIEIEGVCPWPTKNQIIKYQKYLLILL